MGIQWMKEEITHYQEGSPKPKLGPNLLQGRHNLGTQRMAGKARKPGPSWIPSIKKGRVRLEKGKGKNKNTCSLREWLKGQISPTKSPGKAS